METPVHNKELIAAVDDLRNRKIIKQDNDIVEKTGYSKSTVSGYISGNVKASGRFIKEFENQFNIKVSNYASPLENGSGYPSGEAALPGHATLDDHIQLYRQWLADKETKYQDSHSANMKLLELLNTKLAEIESNLKTGQIQLKEQLFVVGDGLAQQLDGIASGLSARDKKAQVVKKDTNVSAKQRDGDGKNKGHL